MEINPYNNNIQSLSGVQSGLLEKISSAQNINKTSDDPSGMLIADQLGLQKSSLAQSVQNYNSGIAMSNIAQSGISSQKDILENIRTETLKAMNGTVSDEGREAIANQISKYIDQYEQIANTTGYNGTDLLKTSGDATDDISVVGEKSIIGMQKADTTSILDTLKSFMSSFATDKNSADGLLKAVDKGTDQLNIYASDFGSASNMLQSNAREAISEETNMSKAKSTISDIDYTKEVSDFSKTNLMSQIAMIVQSQANAVQSRSVPLLS